MSSSSDHHAPILDVDLAAFEHGDATARAGVVDGLMRSLGCGFVYLKHGISETMLDDVYGALAEFFAADSDVKQRFAVPGSFGARGYTGLLVETAAGSELADWKEMLNWGTGLDPAHPLAVQHPHQYLPPVLPEAVVPGITELLMMFHDTIAELQRRVLHIVAAGVGVHESFFDRLITHGTHLTRAIHYPAMRTAPGADHIWAGAHVDINLITALPRATAAGLQLRVDERWCDVTPPDGHAIVNSGIMLETLTNGVIPAGWHRVISSGDAEPRYSIVQFCHPAPWYMLAPLPTCVTPDNPLRYPTLSAASALAEVLYDINLATPPVS